jgi:FkbM family methyltransferase
MAKKTGGAGGVFGQYTRIASTRVGDMLHVKHDQFIGKSLSTYGEWAQNEIEHLLRYLKLGDFVIDVGANIGFHALSFARKVGRPGVVWAFEPDPVNGLLLRHNIMHTGMDEVVIPFDTAVSDATGLCRFRTHPISIPENFGHTGVDAHEGNYPRIALSLDALVIERAPALIKIDIEGHELEALEGMRNLIEKFGPVLSIEADTVEDVEASGSFVAALGYDIYSLIVDAYNPHNYAENGTDIWKGHGRCSNLLCVVPGKHRPPEGLNLVRKASPEQQAISQFGRGVAAAYSAVPPGQSGAAGPLDIHDGVSTIRAEVRRFVSGFLRTTYGKLDPIAHADLVDSALDFLAANGASAEGAALQKLIIAGVEAFAEALGERVNTEDLTRIKEERDHLFEQLHELQENVASQESGRRELESKYQLGLQEREARLAAAKASEVRLNAELAHQATIAKQEVFEALQNVAVLEQKLGRATEEMTRFSAEHSDFQLRLAEAKELQTQAAADMELVRIEAENELANAKDENKQLSEQLHELQENVASQESGRRELESKYQLGLQEREARLAEAKELQTQAAADMELVRIEAKNELANAKDENKQLSEQLKEAEDRLALQSLQIRRLRAAAT